VLHQHAESVADVVQKVVHYSLGARREHRIGPGWRAAREWS
jgi:hypothetical protein